MMLSTFLENYKFKIHFFSFLNTNLLKYIKKEKKDKKIKFTKIIYNKTIKRNMEGKIKRILFSIYHIN